MVATPPGNYSSEHISLQFHGSLPGGEVWSFGLRTGGATPTPGVLQVYATYAIAMAVKNWTKAASDLGSYNSVDTKLLGVTARALDITGVTTNVAEAAPLVPTAGAAAAQSAPNQSALCVSLGTNLAGRHGKGRVFLPYLNPSFDPAKPGKINFVTAHAAGQFVANLISDLNVVDEAYAGDPPLQFWPICVQSRTRVGAPPPVSKVIVGDVVDTIRGRRNKLLEAYQSMPVTVAGA